LEDYYITKAGVEQAKNFLPAAPTNLALNSKNIFLKGRGQSGIIDLFDGRGNQWLPPITMVTQFVESLVSKNVLAISLHQRF
jgi:hypothetical protein